MLFILIHNNFLLSSVSTSFKYHTYLKAIILLCMNVIYAREFPLL
jgi:hypothetical protein